MSDEAEDSEAGDPGGVDGDDSGHREIDHTADLGFEVWAADTGTLFVEATRALAELCYDVEAVSAVESRSLEVSGEDPEELLVRWLHEVYLQLEIDGWLTAEVDAVQVGERTVTGTLRGEAHDPERHTVHTEIKAITYHEMEIERGDDALLRTTVVLDV